MKATFRIWRGDATGGAYQDYPTEVSEGMVVLDAVHRIQAEQAPDLAVRWNCKAGKCGSCSAEVNGNPRLMCMARLSTLNLDEPVTVQPMKAFPLVRDLVTDVSWNFAVKKRIKPFKPRPPDAPDGTWRMGQQDVERVQEFRKCIECFLCQDVCHILRDHHLPRELYRAALSPLRGGARNASARYGESSRRIEGCVRHRLLQHHQVLHEGVPRAHHDHGERHHPAQGAGGGRAYDPLRKVLRLKDVAQAEGLPEGTMYQLKPLSRDAIQPALAKAERYRFLNEPAEAESICRDVLDVEPSHQQALIVLLLALTDQFREHASGAAQEADEILRRLANDYERAYYSGIVRERRESAARSRRTGISVVGVRMAPRSHDAANEPRRSVPRETMTRS